MNPSPAIAASIQPERSLRNAWFRTFTTGRRFWEFGRFIYNAILALLSGGYFLTRLPASRELLTTDSGLTFALFVIAANIFYSVAYLSEFIIQVTLPQHSARPVRVMVLLVGTIFACFVAGFAIDCLLLGAAD